MGKPADQTPSPSRRVSNGAEPQSSVRKVPRRRLIQSTLFPLKPHDKKSDNSAKIEVVEVEKIDAIDVDNNGDDDVVECIGSQSGKKKRGRKPKQNSTPQKRRSKKISGNGNDSSVVAVDDIGSPDDGSPQPQKEKQRTPAKNGRANCNKRTPNGKTPPCPATDRPVPQPVPDLWQEARKTAEENSRIFAGKQIHPFFSSRKNGKKEQETGEVNCYGRLNKNKENYAESGPIHVLDDANDNFDPIDWSNWTLNDRPFSHTTCNQERESFPFKDTMCPPKFSTTSDLNLSATSLLLRNILSSLFPVHEHSSALPTYISPMMVDEQVMPFNLMLNIQKELEVTQLYCIGSGDDGLNSEPGHLNLQQERMISYYLNRVKKPENCLWTNKYQPEKASEVCGNTEAVKFINDWLHLWDAADLHFSKKSRNPDKFIVEDDKLDSSDSDSDMGNVNEASVLKNVLLVSGPVGSGKSAAIYACAKEQGFQVVEVNASDWRHGALLKQKFGEAVGLHWLKRSQETPLGSQSELNSQSSPAVLSKATHAFDLNNPAIEVISLFEEEEELGGGVEIQCRNNQDEIKTLMLFEDVDANLCEDRGFISTIQQLADTSKRPMILTTNSDSPDLPNNLDREEICFTMPSLKELVHHLSLVCAAEKSTVQPHLIERCIEFCRRDIRKTMMHLQFWCQGKKPVTDTKMLSVSPQMFSLEAAHCTLPKLIPLALPSSLAEFIEAEMSQSLCREEEDYCLLDVIEEENVLNQLDFDRGEAASIETKKEAILSGNCFLHVDNDNISVRSTCELPNCSPSPIAFSRRRNVRRKLDTVLSDSEEELSNHEKSPVLNDLSSDLDNNKVPAVASSFHIPFPVLDGTSNGFGDHLLLPGSRKIEETRHQSSESVDTDHINYFAIQKSCNQPSIVFVNSEESDNPEVKHQLDMNPGYLEAPKDLMNLLLEQSSETEEAQMEVNGNQFQGMCNAQKNISAMGTPRHHPADPLIHFGEVKVALTDHQISAGHSLNEFNDHLHECGETNATAARRLFSPIRPTNCVSCEIGSPGNLSSELIRQCLSVDVSRVPESTYVPETEVSDRTDFPVGTDVMDIVSPVTNGDVGTPIGRQEARKNAVFDSGIDVNVSGEQMGDSQIENQHLEASTSGCQVMDECSRMDFCRKFRRLKSKVRAKNLVQERWNGLRLMDLKQYSVAEHADGLQVLDLVQGVSNLISESDLLLHDSSVLFSDSCDEGMCLREETVTFGWLDQQAQMASLISELGYCLYANDIDALQSKMGTDCSLHLSWEMLKSTNNSMTLGKLLRLNRSEASLEASLAERSSNLAPLIVDISFRRERKAHLENIVQSVAPLRSHLALGGHLHEYLSSLSHISRSEASRLSGASEKTKRRGVRASRNYLTSGGLDLSQDDISILNEYHSYGKSSSKSTL